MSKNLGNTKSEKPKKKEAITLAHGAGGRVMQELITRSTRLVVSHPRDVLRSVCASPLDSDPPVSPRTSRGRQTPAPPRPCGRRTRRPQR